MKWMLTAALVLSSALQYPAKGIAQTKVPATIQQPVQPTNKPASPKQQTSRPVFIWPKTPPRLTTVSGRRTGMGSRNDCPAVGTALTALVPVQEQEVASKHINTSSIPVDVWGLTTSERPTFWFYIPYTNGSGEFVLQDKQENDIYRNAIAIGAKPGVIGVSLPSTVALQEGKTYRWYFKVNCDRQKTAAVPVYVEGDIQRISLHPRIEQQLAAATNPHQKIAIYAANGIWFDALTMLAQQRLAHPDDASVVSDWQILLRSVRLEDVATSPLIK